METDREISDTIEFERGERFTRHLVADRSRLYGFVFSLVHDRSAAEDILQEVSAVMWRKFDGFEEGTNFAAWGIKVARLTVLEWRRKQARLPLPMAEDELELLMDESEKMTDEFGEIREALRACLGELPERQKRLIRCRYFEEENVAAIAGRWKRTRMAIYKSLKKTHENLLDCIKGRTAATERGGAT